MMMTNSNVHHQIKMIRNKPDPTKSDPNKK